MAHSSRHHGLGRGLDALIEGGGVGAGAGGGGEGVGVGVGVGVRVVEAGCIVGGRWQPRRAFREGGLQELAASIRERGVLQPLLVRGLGDGRYELIAGERRFRAAQLAGLKRVPVLVQEAGDREALELALVENIQREDLNLIEEARGYETLTKEFGLTQEEVAKRVGKARATVTNCLRLLELSDSIQRAVAAGELSGGHAKVLLGVEEGRREALATRTIAQGLSVRALERLVKAGVGGKRGRVGGNRVGDDRQARQLRHLSERIQQELGTKVTLTAPRVGADGRQARGLLTIEYYDDEDLTRLLEALHLGDLG